MSQHCKLNTGHLMPSIGFGTWQAMDDEIEKAMDAALAAGYRHIDTATVYENEHIIGKVLNRWLTSGKIKREELFIVTKLPVYGCRPSGVEKYINQSLKALQLDYLDLYLVHTPFAFPEIEGMKYPVKDGHIMLDTTTDHVAIWKEMEKQVDNGKAKAIGLSNFNEKQIQRVLDNARIKPAVLQVELHAYFQQVPLVEFCSKNGMIVTAYSPLGSPGVNLFIQKLGGKSIELPDILNNPTITALAKAHNKTAAQIMLRHAVQKGIVAIPKSTNPGRIQQNLEVFDFSLNAEEMRRMNALDMGLAGRIFDMQIWPGVNKHPEYPF